ncbi:RnfABCDGE type electron transport complex subunit G [Lutibacter sp.]|uniref:RnfABCDGE type electron transport complex subunit G n=1 Tax=Lutibacter sp. TaxID=1925666 RepID=UPI002736A34D|nr:RnfABCDGE type electron transport complex subunit G [Lutibacter sp.]MDP3312140.1 RnfABCDGE type electron transport complex subunit G [Lutibacter sp.]
MPKKESTFMNMVVALLTITLVSGLSLGLVNDLTIGPKAKAKLEQKVNALKLVLPTFDNNPVSDVIIGKSDLVKDSIELFPAFSDSQFVGAAVVGSTEKGFSGLIKIMVGFSAEGNIENIVVLEQKETPGLGTKMKDESFINQYKGKNPSAFNMKVKKDGGEIDALTGATITSRAFCDAAQVAYDEYVKNVEVLKVAKH